MQEISPDSKDILILALIGSVLPGMWLLYRLNLFNVFNAINDEKKILLPSFLFLFCPFLIPFIFNHPLPGALSSIIPVTTFILGQIIAESNNKKLLSEKEKEAIHQLYAKLSINFATAKHNESRLESYLTRQFSPRWNDLSSMEDIKEELIKLVSFQGLIPEDLHLASYQLIISTRECARLIDKFNTDLAQRKISGNEIKGDMDITEGIGPYRAIRAIDENLLSYTKDFLLYQNEFLDLC